MRGDKFKYLLVSNYINDLGYDFVIYDELPKSDKITQLNKYEVDLIDINNKIVIEINGEQHYCPVKWNKDQTDAIKKYKKQIYNDKQKELILYSLGYKLIILPDDLDISCKETLQEFIINELNRIYPITFFVNKNEFDWLFEQSKELADNYMPVPKECLKRGIPNLIYQIIKQTLYNELNWKKWEELEYGDDYRNKNKKTKRKNYTIIDRSLYNKITSFAKDINLTLDQLINEIINDCIKNGKYKTIKHKVENKYPLFLDEEITIKLEILRREKFNNLSKNELINSLFNSFFNKNQKTA